MPNRPSTESRSGAEKASQPDLRPKDELARRRWTQALVAMGLLAVTVTPFLVTSDTSPRRQLAPSLMHTIARGDLTVSVTEQGTLESSDNTEIKCKVRGDSTVIWVVETGTEVQPGDDLVRLDTLEIEDAIAERTKYAHLTRSGAERARADVARAELAVSEYLEGRYRTQLMTLEKDLAVAESNLRTARDALSHAQRLLEREYVSDMEVEDKTVAVRQAEMNVEVKNTEIDVLKNYTKAMELETLKGELKAARASYAAEAERAKMDAARRDLALEEFEHCVVKAERSGLVIHPAAAQWKNSPEIEEGSTVHKDQVLLLMPDLSKMQVKVGIHESVVERVRPGLPARITLPDRTLEGEVASVALVTRPAGWWTGNVVKYDTIVKLPSVAALKPGMSAEVEVVLQRHKNVVLIPVSAVVSTVEGDFCWTNAPSGVRRRSLELGDADDAFIVVKSGLSEGDSVVLNPLDSVVEAQDEVLIPHGESSAAVEQADKRDAPQTPEDNDDV